MVTSTRTPLIAILLPRPQAAHAIMQAWDRDEAVMVLDPSAPAPELQQLLSAATPTHVLDATGRHCLPGGRAVDQGTAVVVATSGTTGKPKLVAHRSSGITAAARAISEALHTTEADHWLCCVPLTGVAGLAILARARHSGIRCTVLERFDPREIEADRESTLISLVPTMLQRLLDHESSSGSKDALPPGEAQSDRVSRLARFRHVLLGGAPLSPPLRARAERAGVAVVTTYGMSETFGGVVHEGHPLGGVEFRTSQAGELLIRGPMIFSGYLNDPEATAHVLQDGWLHTGDAGQVLPDGRIEVIGRLDDTIISGGVNVHPAEVEAVLAKHPSIADVAVTGADDPEWGQRVVAFVVARDGARPPDVAELRRFAGQLLSAAKLPRQVVFLDHLPRNPGGKVLRRLLGTPAPGPSEAQDALPSRDGIARANPAAAGLASAT